MSSNNKIKNIQKSYERKIKKFEKYEKQGCNETSHIIQDEIYRKFIKDIQNKKINNMDEVYFVSKLILDKVIIYDKNRWYA